MAARWPGSARLPLVLALPLASAAYRWLAARPRPGAPYLAGSPLLIAHRGGSALAPENTLLAFQRAVEWWHADVLELDVQPTSDGEAVVFHDSTLDRTTDGAGAVAERPLAELRELDAGYGFSPDDGRTHPFRGRGVGISSLADVLAAFPATRVNVEIKDALAQEAVWRSVREAGAAHRVLIAAGRRADRARFATYPGATSAAEEELRLFYLHHRLHAAALYCPPVEALQMPEHHAGRQLVSARFVRDAHAKNLAVHIWTVDEVEDMERLLSWGVDGIITDRPDRLARVLYERAGRPLPPGPPAADVEPFLERLLRT